MFKNALAEIPSQLLSAVKLEVHLAIDVLPTDERVLASEYINDRLEGCLMRALGQVQRLPRSGNASVRAGIRKALLKEINSISHGLLIQAKSGFEALASTPVHFWINVANGAIPAEFEEFDWLQMPFIRFHGEAIDAALQLRALPERVQLDLLRIAYYRCELEVLEMVSGLAREPEDMEEDRLRCAVLTTGQGKLKKHLPATALENLDTFYGCLEGVSIYPYALPIGLPLTLADDDLLFAAEAFRRIGNEFMLRVDIMFQGADGDVRQANAAKLQFESAGIGLQILSAWMKALDVLNGARLCSICYRHASAISRCSTHATKTHETSDARLGKKIRPLYQSRLQSYWETDPVRRLLRNDFYQPENASAELKAAAGRTNLATMTCHRALVLAIQLRGLLAVMNSDMQASAERLFESILNVAAVVEKQPPPGSVRERRVHDQRWQAAKELLSIKGFFKAWCGSGRYSADIDLMMLGFDRDHPAVKGRALPSNEVPKLMVRQRAWTEAVSEFTAAKAPSAQDVYRILGQGYDKQAVAQQLGIALSTVYKILRRGDNPRRRQYLG